MSPDLLRKEGSNAEKCLLFLRSLSVFFRGGGSSEIPSTWQRVTTQGPLEGGVWGGGGKSEATTFGQELPPAKSENRAVISQICLLQLPFCVSGGGRVSVAKHG